MRGMLLGVALVALALAGCSSPPPSGVREVAIHIGYSSDRTQQYLEPKEIAARLGERLRFVITNDDRPGAPDAFHDVAFTYPGVGLVEHEVPAGATVRTCLPQAEPDRACPAGRDAFAAPTAGRFKLYCEVGPLGRSNPDGTPRTRHEQMGMWGTLVVQ